MSTQPATMFYSIGGSSPLPRGAQQVDLVNWLDAPASTQQGFREGAKETYHPPSSSSLFLPSSAYSSPAYSDDYDDLLGTDLAGDNLDDCLSLDMSDDNWHRRLSGEDAKWAEQVSRDYRQLRQKKKSAICSSSRELADNCTVGPVADDGYLSNEPTDSPPYQQMYQGGFYSPQSVATSPFSEAYNSPEYQSFQTQDQSPFQVDEDLTVLEDEDMKYLMESVSFPTSPSSKDAGSTERYDADSFDNIYRMICEDSEKDLTPLEEMETSPAVESFDRSRQSENIWLDNSEAEPSYVSNNVVESEDTVLKDVIDEEGDSILQDLISPIQQADGSQITASYDVRSIEGSSLQTGLDCSAKRTKRVPFTAEERRLRKKEQNKRAAIKYREKKRSETDDAADRFEAVIKKNSELKEKKRRALAEFDVIRSLLLEKLRQPRG